MAIMITPTAPPTAIPIIFTLERPGVDCEGVEVPVALSERYLVMVSGPELLVDAGKRVWIVVVNVLPGLVIVATGNC
jgi:hypothetical protein